MTDKSQETIVKKILEKEKALHQLALGLEKLLQCDYTKSLDELSLCDIILDLYGIPKDNTLEYDIYNPKSYCRDYFFDTILDYCEDKITLDEIVTILKRG